MEHIYLYENDLADLWVYTYIGPSRAGFCRRDRTDGNAVRLAPIAPGCPRQHTHSVPRARVWLNTAHANGGCCCCEKCERAAHATPPGGSSAAGGGGGRPSPRRPASAATRARRRARPRAARRRGAAPTRPRARRRAGGDVHGRDGRVDEAGVGRAPRKLVPKSGCCCCCCCCDEGGGCCWGTTSRRQ